MPAPAPPYLQQIGPHQIRVDGNVLHIHFQGPYLPDEAKQALSLLKRVQAEQGPVYLLINLAHTGVPSLETRRILSQADTHLMVQANVYYGVSFLTRAIAILIHRMLSLISNQDAKVFFVSDESEGLRKIQGLRLEPAQPAS